LNARCASRRCREREVEPVRPERAGEIAPGSVGLVAVDEVDDRNSRRLDDIGEQQVPEARRMPLRQSDVLVQLKDFDLRPVDVRGLDKLALKVEL
jgi:hypothetical protein